MVFLENQDNIQQILQVEVARKFRDHRVLVGQDRFESIEITNAFQTWEITEVLFQALDENSYVPEGFLSDTGILVVANDLINATIKVYLDKKIACRPSCIKLTVHWLRLSDGFIPPPQVFEDIRAEKNRFINNVSFIYWGNATEPPSPDMILSNSEIRPGQ